MNNTSLKFILEALLMNSSEPLSLERILSVFEEGRGPSSEQALVALKELAEDYRDRSIELKELATGYCFQTRTEYSSWISNLYAEKPAKYSRALLETLAIIAYQQPVTRADIEDKRGVSLSSSILKTLVEREWVKIAGYRDVPGKPAVYATTKTFLDYFNLKSLKELPTLPNLKEECVEE